MEGLLKLDSPAIVLMIASKYLAFLDADGTYPAEKIQNYIVYEGREVMISL